MVSNVQKIRSAARHLLCVIEEMGFKPWCADNPLAIACDKLDAALAGPFRNCDVGTAQEQYARFREYCFSKRCESLIKKTTLGSEVAFVWSQMPYEEGGAK